MMKTNGSAPLVFVLLTAGWVFAQSVNITGTWKSQTAGPQGKLAQSITFQQTGDSFTGELITSQGVKEPIRNGKLKGDELEFTVERRRSATETALVHYIGKVNGEDISGTFIGASGRTISWTAKRKGRSVP